MTVSHVKLLSLARDALREQLKVGASNVPVEATSTLLHPHKSRSNLVVLPGLFTYAAQCVGSKSRPSFKRSRLSSRATTHVRGSACRKMPGLGIFQCRHCQFLVGANSHGNLLVVIYWPLGRSWCPPREPLATARATLPTFASDSLKIYRVESFSKHAPRRAIRIYICWACEWLRWLRDRIWPRIDLSLRG